MYSQLDLSEGIAEFLQTVESIHDVPIRVIDCGFNSNFNPPPWDDEHLASDSSFSLSDAIEKGITVCSWGAITGGEPRSITGPSISGWLYKDGAAREPLLPDFLTHGGNGLAYPLASPDGFIYGEVADRTVWLYFHMFYIPDASELELVNLLGDPIAKSMDPELASSMEQERGAINERRFLNMCVNFRQGTNLNTRRETIRELESNVQTYGSRLTAALTQLQTEKEEIDILLERFNRSEDQWLSEWRRMQDHPRIKVNFTGESMIEVLTDEITMTHPNTGEEAKLGHMKWILNLGDNNIRIENLDNRRRDRDHPHIENGRPCWGSIQTTISDLMANGRLAMLVEVIFQYLESFNPEDDWGRYAQWFYVSADQLSEVP
jgi:hypothetical protein